MFAMIDLYMSVCFFLDRMGAVIVWFYTQCSFEFAYMINFVFERVMFSRLTFF